MSTKNRVKTPTLLQMEALECGAAALGIVLAYYKRHIPLEELRIACGVSRDGSKAINMLQAARNYGLKAQGANIEINGLASLTFPCIAFWEFNHFVVLEGFDEQKVYLNDPASGPRTISYEEFNHAFTGVVLLFEQSADFKPGGYVQTLWQNLKPRISGIKSSLLFIILSSLALVIPGIIIAVFAKIFIDNVLIQHLSNWLLPLIWGILITAILRALLTWIQETHLVRLQLKLALTTSAQFLWHVLQLPMTFFNQRYAGDICSRIGANDRFAALISGDLSSSLVGLITMFFYCFVMFLYDWQLTLISIVILLCNAALLLFISEGVVNTNRVLLQDKGKLLSVELIAVQAIETIKASNGENHYFQRWAGYHAKTINNQQRIQLYNRVLLILPPLLNGILNAIILTLGGIHIMNGSLTIGALVAFQSLLISFNAPLMTLLGLGNKLQEIRGDMTRLNDVFNYPKDQQFSSQIPRNPVNNYGQSLELKKISFGYSLLESPLLNDISLSLSSGKTLGIVGASGCGKSTLAKIICGLYIPWSGEILIDNHKIQQIPRADLAKNLSFVDQDIFLYEGSIQDNLTLWDADIPSNQIEEAIVDAELSSLLTQRSQGLQSKVTTLGMNFSGGQRQQLEIARALATKPNFLILDEATASLDALTEAKIITNIKKRGCAVLMIAHRLSAICQCDEIIVLKQGEIVARGTHASLWQQEAEYTRLLTKVPHERE